MLEFLVLLRGEMRFGLKLRVDSLELRVSWGVESGLVVSSFRFQVSSFRFQVSGFKGSRFKESDYDAR